MRVLKLSERRRIIEAGIRFSVDSDCYEQRAAAPGQTFMRMFYFFILYAFFFISDLRYFLRRSADMSLDRPGRKQATATNIGIYST